MMHVVCYGNPFDGISLVGPFADHETALAYVDSDSEEWRIVEVDPPPSEFHAPENPE